MKLLRCDIENFGKLQDFHYQFSEGITTICEDNGWGKTTLSVFIKSMFYGMDYNRKRKLIEENERMKYFPWQGGSYGGRLDFEVNGKRYQVRRFFGKTDKDDTFFLYDLQTNLESRDYSENLGEELFSINKEGYERSTFIPQRKTEVTVNDSIIAKLSNVLESGDDVGQYEAALELLNKKRKEFQADRGQGGVINEIRSQLDWTMVELRKCQDEEAVLQRVTAQLSALNEARKEQQAEQERLKIQSNHFLTERDKKVSLEHYHSLCGKERERKAEIKDLEGFFNGMPPSSEELQMAERLCDEIDAEEQKIHSYQLDANEAEHYRSLQIFFPAGIPALDELADDTYYHLNSLQDKQARIERYQITEAELAAKQQFEDYFRMCPYEPDLLGHYRSRCSELNQLRIAKNREPLQDYQNDIEVVKSKLSVSVIILLVGVVVISAFLCFINLFVGIAALVVGAMGLLLVIAAQKNVAAEPVPKVVNSQHHDWEEQEKIIQRDVHEFLSKYPVEFVVGEEYDTLDIIQRNGNRQKELLSRIAEKNSEFEKEKQALEKSQQWLHAMLDDYPWRDLGISYEEKWKKLRENAKDFEYLEEKRKHYQTAVNQKQMKEEQIKAFLSRFYSLSDSSYQILITELKEKEREYEMQIRQWNEANREKLAFEIANDVAALEHMEFSETDYQEIQNQLDSVLAAIQEIDKELLIGQTEKHRLEELVGRISEIESEQEHLAMQLKECETEHRIIQETIYFLQKAKEQFLTQYLRPMEESFKKYYSMIDETSYQGQALDANLNVTLESHGKKHQMDFFSRGYQEFVGLCLRLALIDVMFKEECPFLILDDCFVNLDEQKMANGKTLLAAVAKKYQIIYFTCHSSRAVS